MKDMIAQKYLDMGISREVYEFGSKIEETLNGCSVQFRPEDRGKSSRPAAEPASPGASSLHLCRYLTRRMGHHCKLADFLQLIRIEQECPPVPPVLFSVLPSVFENGGISKSPNSSSLRESLNITWLYPIRTALHESALL